MNKMVPRIDLSSKAVAPITGWIFEDRRGNVRGPMVRRDKYKGPYPYMCPNTKMTYTEYGYWSAYVDKDGAAKNHHTPFDLIRACGPRRK